MPSQCVRIYRFQAGSLGRVTRSIEFSLAPALAAQPGFLCYRFVATADDRALSESTWETEAQAAFADVIEADWVRGNVNDDLAGLPDLLIGTIEVDVGA